MSRPYAIDYLPAAQQDLHDIVDYIARDDPSAAPAFVDRIDRVSGRLALHPRSGRRPRDDRLRRRGYRMLVVGDYLAFYVVTGRTVQIRRVIHGARRYKFLLAPLRR